MLYYLVMFVLMAGIICTILELKNATDVKINESVEKLIASAKILGRERFLVVIGVIALITAPLVITVYYYAITHDLATLAIINFAGTLVYWVRVSPKFKVMWKAVRNQPLH